MSKLSANSKLIGIFIFTFILMMIAAFVCYNNTDSDIFSQKIIFKYTICIVVLSLIQASLLYLVIKDINQPDLIEKKITDITENNAHHFKNDHSSNLAILEIKNVNSSLQDLISSIKDDHIYSEEASKATEYLDKLLEFANEFTNIIDNISNIEEQINLLAINSSIEASRSGINGNGLKIIAEEMTSLSSQINSLSNNSKVKIESLQKYILKLDDYLNNKHETTVKPQYSMIKITKYLDRISNLIAKIST